MIALLPGHESAWRIDSPADAPADAPGRATWQALATAAQQIATQDIEPRQRWRMARLAGFSPIEAATIAKVAKLGTWQKFLDNARGAPWAIDTNMGINSQNE